MTHLATEFSGFVPERGEPGETMVARSSDASGDPMSDPQLLAYDDVGDGAPLVLVHGLTFSRRTWDPLVACLQGRFRCIVVDLPGHGDSGGSGADPREVCDRLHRTLTTLEAGRPVVIGHSAGALLATAYASTFPAAAVVNIDQPLLVGRFATLVQQLAEALRGPDFRTAFAPFEQSIGVDRLPEPERTRVAETRHIDQTTVLDHWTMPLSAPPATLQADLDDVVDQVLVPYVYLAGDEPGPAVRQHLHEHLRQHEVVVWPGRGHLVHLTDPEGFADLIRALTARLP
jgi:pimeloyl-ACP methyl ester carboxylesterase